MPPAAPPQNSQAPSTRRGRQLQHNSCSPYRGCQMSSAGRSNALKPITMSPAPHTVASIAVGRTKERQQHQQIIPEWCVISSLLRALLLLIGVRLFFEHNLVPHQRILYTVQQQQIVVPLLLLLYPFLPGPLFPVRPLALKKHS